MSMIEFRGKKVWLKLDDLSSLALQTQEDAEEFLEAYLKSFLEDFTGFETMEQDRENCLYGIIWVIGFDLKYREGDRAEAERLRDLFWPEEIKHFNTLFEETKRLYERGS